MKLSIIVPVYNVEKYLRRCLDSLVGQTLADDYEIIVVNDGTKDNSQEIIDEYTEKYPFVLSYIKENGGLSSARNFGVRLALGEYITFVDSDDYVEPDYYENMLKKAEEDGSDLVIADFEYVWENNEKEAFVKKGYNEVSEDIRKSLLLSPLLSWNKLYKRSLFNKLSLEYPVGLWYEDIPVTLAYFLGSNTVSYYQGVGVHYVQRGTSIMGSRKYSPKLYDIFTIFDNVIAYFKDNDFFEMYHDELEYLVVEHIVLYGSFRFLQIDCYEELMKQSFVYVKKLFPEYKKNKYLKTLGFKNNVFIRTISPATMKIWKRVLDK